MLQLLVLPPDAKITLTSEAGWHSSMKTRDSAPSAVHLSRKENSRERALCSSVQSAMSINSRSSIHPAAWKNRIKARDLYRYCFGCNDL